MIEKEQQLLARVLDLFALGARSGSLHRADMR